MSSEFNSSEYYRVDPDLGLVYGKFGRPIMAKSGGYYQVRRKGFTRYVHQMVWEEVHGPIRKGLEINHMNGIKTDNRICNLELVTRLENVRHAFRTGLNNKSGEAHHLSKLSDEDIMFIRRNRAVLSLGELAAKFSVHKSTVCDIASGKTWRHLPLK